MPESTLQLKCELFQVNRILRKPLLAQKMEWNQSEILPVMSCTKRNRREVVVYVPARRINGCPAARFVRPRGADVLRTGSSHPIHRARSRDHTGPAC